MNRPKYKELYLKEKRNTKFTYHVLESITKMLNEIGINAEIEKKFNNYTFSDVYILKLFNPDNYLWGNVQINSDFMGEENETNN